MDAVQWKLNVLFVAMTFMVVWGWLRERRLARRLLVLKETIEVKRAAAQRPTTEKILKTA